MFMCANKHDSQTGDFCSVCGAELTAAPAAAIPDASAAAAPPEQCPDCGAVREFRSQAFCEACGHNFRTGAPGVVPPPPPGASAPVRWEVVVGVDAGHRGTVDPAAPIGTPPRTFTLFDEQTLVGRPAAGVRAQVVVADDPGVSRRQLLLLRRPDGTLAVRDPGSANGTRLNGADVTPGVDTPVADGDRLAVGAWTVPDGEGGAVMTTTQTMANGQITTSRPIVPAAEGMAFTTPGLLRLWLGGTWALSAVFLLAAGVGLERHRHAVQTVGRDAAPSIVAAQRLRTSFARAHADATLILAGRADAAAAYDGHRSDAADGLVSAAENITYGDAERLPIRRMVDGFGRYGADVARARATAGGTSAAAFDAADHVLHDELLPAADALDRANRDALERGYSTERASAAWGMGWTAVAGLSLLAWLVGAQAFVTIRTRRMVNPGLVVATVATAAAVAWVIGAMAASAGHLRVAKADAFDSVSALWQARAVAVDAYAARLGGDRSGRAAAAAARLASPPAGMTLDDVASACEGGAVPDGFTGLLADELRNITFPGEREAAVETLRSFAAYQATGGTAAFVQFDAALGRTLDLNQSAFDANVADGFASVDGPGPVAAVAAAATAVAAYLGLRPRLREYAV